MLIILLAAPLGLFLTGIIKVTSKDAKVRKSGSMFLLVAVGLFLTEVLIGYSVCTNIHIAGGH